MAVDTRDKRASALGIVAPLVPTFPLADGNIANQADRQNAAFSYTGILASSPVAQTVRQSAFESRIFASSVLTGRVL